MQLRKSAFLLVGWVIALGCALVPSTGQAAEEYKSIEPARSLYITSADSAEELRKKKDRYRNVLEQVRDVLKGKVPLADKQTVVDAWYANFIFAKMTLFTPEALVELPKERESFFKELLSSATDPEAHSYVIGLTLKEMGKIAQEEYHPAARYNAMLIISELNTREIVRRSGSETPPEGHLPALQFMLKELENKDQLEIVKYAALLGLVRHASLEVYHSRLKTASPKMPAPEWDKIRKACLQIVRDDKPQPNRDPRGYAWFRRRAMEALGWMAAAKQEPEIVKELVARVGNGKEIRTVRCEAAYALGNTMYGGPVNVKLREVATAIAQFVLDAVEEDNFRLEQLRSMSDEQRALYAADSAAGSGYGDVGGGPRPMKGPAKNADHYGYRLDPVRRRLKHEIGCAMYGLIGTLEKKKSAIDPIYGLLAAYKSKGVGEKDVEPRTPADKLFLDKLSRSLQDIARAADADRTDTYLAEMVAAADITRELIAENPLAAPREAAEEKVEPAAPAAPMKPKPPELDPNSPE